MKNKKFIYATILVALLTAIAIFLPFQDNIIIKITRIIFWSIFILFLPWYYLTLVFFSDKEIDFLEIFALSFALSISVIPLITFYLNLVWLKISQYSVYGITIFVIILSFLYLKFFAKWWKI